jgi:hypothetical protein
LAVDVHGEVLEADIFDGSVVARGWLGLPPNDDLAHGAALVLSLACPEGLLVTVGRLGTVGCWDVAAQQHAWTRSLRGLSDAKSQRGGGGGGGAGGEVALCGSSWGKGGDGWVFVARGRSSAVACVRVASNAGGKAGSACVGVGHDKGPGDPSHPHAHVTALACHPGRPWLCTALGHAPAHTSGEGPASATASHYQGEVRIWDYASLSTATSGGGGEGEEGVSTAA